MTARPALRRFSDMAQNLPDLWNEMVVPLGLSRVDVINESRERKIMEAYKTFPDKEDWVAILDEFKVSLFLQNKKGTDGHLLRDFDWFISKGKDGIENYIKVHNGRYPDTTQSGVSDLAQHNMDVVKRVLERRRLRALAEQGGSDVPTGAAGALHDGPGEAGDVPRGEDRGGADRYLPGGPGGSPLREGDGGDPVGEAEHESVPEDF